jgi:4-aminobutyrate aminotransferase-like enzyme
LPYGADTPALERALAGAAAVVFEPLVGREGVIVPPPGWLARLATAARASGALLVADEIFTGFGRTGFRFAVDSEAVRPDLLCCGKALGGGLPIAAVVGRAELFERFRTGGEAIHTATFLAHPLACAAALAALDEIERLDLARRAREIGERVAARLAPFAGAAFELRGRGAIWGLAFADRAAAKRFAQALGERGFLALAGGPEGRVVQLAPPLTIAWNQLDLALEAIAGLSRGAAPPR